MKPEPLFYGDRKVFTVAGFNQGISLWLGRLPQVWVEGELTELTRQAGRPMVFFTLKDPAGGSSVGVTMRRAAFDALELELVEGARVHVLGRAELWHVRGSFRLHAETIELFGLGQVLARLEALKRTLAAEGLLDPARKRALPFIPGLVGVVTGSDAAAKHDVLATITARFPPARVLVAETYVQGPRAPGAIAVAPGTTTATETTGTARTETACSSPRAGMYLKRVSSQASLTASGLPTIAAHPVIPSPRRRRTLPMPSWFSPLKAASTSWSHSGSYRKTVQLSERVTSTTAWAVSWSISFSLRDELAALLMRCRAVNSATRLLRSASRAA